MPDSTPRPPSLLPIAQEVFHGPIHRSLARHAVRASRSPRGRKDLEGPAGPRGDQPRTSRPSTRGSRQVHRRSAVPLKPGGRPRRLRARYGHPRGENANRLQGGVQAVCRSGLAGTLLRPGLRRAGSAARGADPVPGNDEFGQSGMGHVSGPDPRRLWRLARARHRRTEGRGAAQACVGRVDRHHVPDGAALRHRPWHAARESRAASRRQLPDHRRQDLHLVR